METKSFPCSLLVSKLLEATDTCVPSNYPHCLMMIRGVQIRRILILVILIVLIVMIMPMAVSNYMCILTMMTYVLQTDFNVYILIPRRCRLTRCQARRQALYGDRYERNEKLEGIINVLLTMVSFSPIPCQITLYFLPFIPISTQRPNFLACQTLHQI